MSGSAARLEVLTGKAAGTSILVDDELIIGRLAEGVGRLADDEEISRSHARLSVDTSGSCAIEDLGSTNGTFVNGMRIAAPQTLSEGDTVEVGGTTLVVRELPGREAPSEPAAQPPSRQDTVSHDTPIFAPGGVATEAPREESADPAGAPAVDEAAAATETVPTGAEAMPSSAESPSDDATAGEIESVPVPGDPLGAVEVPSRASLRLEIDFAGRELQISLDGDAEPIRLVFTGDGWERPALPSTEKGTTE